MIPPGCPPDGAQICHPPAVDAGAHQTGPRRPRRPGAPGGASSPPAGGRWGRTAATAGPGGRGRGPGQRDGRTTACPGRLARMAGSRGWGAHAVRASRFLGPMRRGSSTAVHAQPGRRRCGSPSGHRGHPRRLPVAPGEGALTTACTGSGETRKDRSARAASSPPPPPGVAPGRGSPGVPRREADPARPPDDLPRPGLKSTAPRYSTSPPAVQLKTFATRGAVWKFCTCKGEGEPAGRA